jgi:hypothetical protein
MLTRRLFLEADCIVGIIIIIINGIRDHVKQPE